MQLIVKTISGGKYNIDADDNDKIEKLKKIIQEKTGIDPTQQRLVLSGKILNDDKTVKELGLKPGTVIQLILQLKGGSF